MIFSVAAIIVLLVGTMCAFSFSLYGAEWLEERRHDTKETKQ